MFSGIKSRFILIYILLVLICMAIVGSFLTNRLETVQLTSVTEEMNRTMDSMVASSDYMLQEDWATVKDRIQNTLDGWRLSADESMYVIINKETPIILGSTVNSRDLIEGKNALSNKDLAAELIVSAFSGKVEEKIVKNTNTDTRTKHLAKPVLSGEGDVKGILYMTTNLDGVYSVIEDTSMILTYATIIGILITGSLGIIIANSITGPIRDVTKKAREMAEGNYKQKVEVKSNDEIGRLASMFNYLTQELDETIGKMDIERSKLDTIFNYMAEGVIAMDRNGHLIHANPIARKILKIPEEDVTKGVKLDLSKINIDGINYYDYSSLKGESQAELNGNFYNVKYAPYKNDSHESTGLIVVFQDVTKEHNLDMMRREFVANVSHELKTPITTIKSYSETLMDEELPNEAKNRFLSIIERESDRMVRLVRDLLFLSNMDYKNTTVEREPLSVYEVVYHVLEGLEYMSEKKHHKLKMVIPDDIHRIYGDPHGVEQVLVNIISNAIKYTPPYGNITVEAKNFINRVIITIKDTGIGIPPKDMSRIFERFYRVEKGRSREMGGTGLGLSIAKEVMEAMDGKITIRSSLREGTEVVLSFPSFDGDVTL
ncbi:MAG: ATP-binding protein [Tissierellia bacterium]|nr:ATP-binding protein [Tissierellia bacterium]